MVDWRANKGTLGVLPTYPRSLVSFSLASRRSEARTLCGGESRGGKGALQYPRPLSYFFLGLGGGIKHINTHNGQKLPDNCNEILQAKANLVRYLKEKFYSEDYKQCSFK